MLAYAFIVLVALNTLLAIYTLWRIKVNQDELDVLLNGLSDSLGAIITQLGKATAEITDAISNAGATTASTDAAVAKLQGVVTALKTAAQTLDDLNADKVVAPPQDDAFVAVGAARFSDGQPQTEESKAAAVAAWNTAHPEGPVAS